MEEKVLPRNGHPTVLNVFTFYILFLSQSVLRARLSTEYFKFSYYFHIFIFLVFLSLFAFLF